MRDFDWKGFKNRKFVVNFKTEKESSEFINFCNKNGLDWFGCNKGYNVWDRYKENTCCAYYHGRLSYGEVCYYEELGIKILQWAKEEGNIFNKEDLEGKFVQLRNGIRGIVINSHIKSETKGIADLKNYDENLESKFGKEWGIVKVSNVRRVMGLSQLFNKPERYTKLIWEREETDWSNVPKYTKVQVRDDEDHKWKNRYFVKYIEGDIEPFCCSLFKVDEFTNSTPAVIPYKYCRLYKED